MSQLLTTPYPIKCSLEVRGTSNLVMNPTYTPIGTTSGDLAANGWKYFMLGEQEFYSGGTAYDPPKKKDIPKIRRGS